MAKIGDLNHLDGWQRYECVALEDVTTKDGLAVRCSRWRAVCSNRDCDQAFDTVLPPAFPCGRAYALNRRCEAHREAGRPSWGDSPTGLPSRLQGEAEGDLGAAARYVLAAERPVTLAATAKELFSRSTGLLVYPHKQAGKDAFVRARAAARILVEQGTIGERRGKRQSFYWRSDVQVEDWPSAFVKQNNEAFLRYGKMTEGERLKHTAARKNVRQIVNDVVYAFVAERSGGVSNSEIVKAVNSSSKLTQDMKTLVGFRENNASSQAFVVFSALTSMAKEKLVYRKGAKYATRWFVGLATAQKAAPNPILPQTLGVVDNTRIGQDMVNYFFTIDHEPIWGFNILVRMARRASEGKTSARDKEYYDSLRGYFMQYDNQEEQWKQDMREFADGCFQLAMDASPYADMAERVPQEGQPPEFLVWRRK